MSTHPADFRVEIIKARPQGVVSPSLGSPVAGEVLDVTGRIMRDGFGSINRAMERDLLSFKTGDLTLSARNHDAFFDDLFAPIVFGATTIWGLRVYRRGEVQFYGCLIGLGSITFDRKAKTVELTAYGLTKLLDMTSAETVKRTFSAMTVTTATGGTATLILNTTSGLLSGDTIHLTDHVNQEDVTVKQVTSTTVVSLEAVLTNSYASGTVAECTTPFYRYQAIDTLVEALFTEAGIGLADLRINNSQFNRLAPTPVNLSGINFAYFVVSGPAEKSGKRMQLTGNAGLTVWESLRQDGPDAAWVIEDATNQPWVDWSRYFVQGSSQPALMLRGIPRPEIFQTDAPNNIESGNLPNPHACGFKFSSTSLIFAISDLIVGAGRVLGFYQTTDGTTWTHPAASEIVLTGGDLTAAEWDSCSAEYLGSDFGSSLTVASHIDGITKRFDLVEWSGGTVTSLKDAADGAGDGYFGPCWIPDKGYFVALRSSSANGPAFEICAYKPTSLTAAPRLWKRTFPSCYITNAGSSGSQNVYPTQTMRYINGSLYCLAVIDGGLNIVWSDDEFVTYRTAQVSSGTTSRGYFGARIGSQYAIAYSDSSQVPRIHQIAAPFYAGVVSYADFEGISIAEALKKLAVITNSLFWVDDDLQGHFVARDLYDVGSVTNIESRIKERQDTLLWDQTAQYVTVSGNSIEATAGDAGFASEGIDLDSAFLPNEAFAQALADSYFAFYSAARQYSESVLHDKDGTIFRPLDRVTPDGASRFLVYESDHSLIDDEVSVTLLEDR